MRYFYLALVLFCISGPTFGQPQAIDGLLDLSDWDFVWDGPAELRGEWEFYWLQYHDSYQLRLRENDLQAWMVEVPGFWNDLRDQDRTLFESGFATYRINVLLANSDRISLRLPTVGTAYNLFIDGKKLLQVGKPGMSELATIPEYRPQIVSFKPKSNRIEIIIQVANFHHRNAGLWEVIRVGNPEQLQIARENQIAVELLFFGAIFMMGIYNLAAWYMRRESMSALYLGCFCLLVGLRVLFVGEKYITQIAGGLGWEFLLRIEYFCWFLAAPLVLAFLKSMFEKDFIKLVVQIFGGVGLFFGVFALLMPIKLVTELIPLYQVVTITGILYAVFGIGRAVWKRREGSVLLGVGCVVLFGTAINDILVALQTLDVENKLHLGVLVFVMLQSVSVTLRYARAFQIIEQQSSELTKTNLELQLEEKLRRTAEGESIALHEQVDHSEKINTLGIIAHTLAEDLRRDKTSTLANRAAQVMSDISNLLRHAPVERGSLNITQLLADFLKSDEFREISDAYPTLQIISDFDNSVSVIEGSATHLFTLLVNTVRYVMASQPEDQVVLFSGRCSEVEHQTLFNQEIEAGEYYILGISDEGEGIDAVDLLEIFDPSQQARAYADLEGPLLNLAAAWKILESHGGALDVYAVPGVTRFELYFPVNRVEEDAD